MGAPTRLGLGQEINEGLQKGAPPGDPIRQISSGEITTVRWPSGKSECAYPSPLLSAFQRIAVDTLVPHF